MKYQFGSIITDGSGKLGGQVFSKNHYGNFVKTKVSPVQPNTSSQLALRSLMASVTSSWESLTDDQRFEWTKFSESYPQKDRFGHTFYLSGFNFFRKVNMVRLNQSMSLLITPLNPLPFPVWELIDIQSFSLNPSIFVFINPSPPAGYIYQIFSTPVLSPGINYCKGKFVLIGNIVEGADFPQDIYDLWYAKFSGTLEPGYALFFKIALIDVNTGFVSSYVIQKVVIQSGYSSSVASVWSDSGSLPSSLFITNCIALSNNNYIATSQNSSSLFLSTDGGITFNLIRNFLPNTVINTISFNESGIGYLSLYNTGASYISNDYALTWSLIPQIDSGTGSQSSIWITPLHLVITRRSTYNVFVSIDGGVSFINIGNLGFTCEKYRLTLIGNSHLIMSFQDNLHYAISNDGGFTWFIYYYPFNGYTFTSYCYVGFNIIIAGSSYNARLYRSIDNGLTWYLVFSPSSGTSVNSIVYLGNGVIIAGVFNTGSLLISFDFGVNWSVIPNPLSSSQIRDLACFPHRSLIAGVAPSSKIIRSTI